MSMSNELDFEVMNKPDFFSQNISKPFIYRFFYTTSTAKQVLGNCDRMVFASIEENFNFDSFNPNFLFTCAVNFYLMIHVVNLYIVLVYCYTMLLG